MDNERPKAGLKEIFFRLRQRLGKGKRVPTQKQEEVVDLGYIGPEPEPEIIIEEIPEIKIDGAGVTLRDAQHEARYSKILHKPRDHSQFREEVDSLPVDDSVKEKLKEFGMSRDGLHVLRLLGGGRSEAERDFGVAYLQFARQARGELLTENREQTERMLHVIGMEGNDTCMWWTMAPYLYINLTKKGVETPQAVKRIIRWAKDGVWDISQHEGWKKDQINLQGLEIINKVGGYGEQSYILSRDPNGPSHVLTNHLARQIVEAKIV